MPNRTGIDCLEVQGYVWWQIWWMAKNREPLWVRSNIENRFKTFPLRHSSKLEKFFQLQQKHIHEDHQLPVTSKEWIWVAKWTKPFKIHEKSPYLFRLHPYFNYSKERRVMKSREEEEEAEFPHFLTSGSLAPPSLPLSLNNFPLFKLTWMQIIC